MLKIWKKSINTEYFLRAPTATSYRDYGQRIHPSYKFVSIIQIPIGEWANIFVMIANNACSNSKQNFRFLGIVKKMILTANNKSHSVHSLTSQSIRNFQRTLKSKRSEQN